MQRHAVHGSRHTVLAHAVMDIATRIVGQVEGFGALHIGIVGPRQVGGTADHFGDRWNQLLKRRTRVLARGGGGL